MVNFLKKRNVSEAAIKKSNRGTVAFFFACTYVPVTAKLCEVIRFGLSKLREIESLQECKFRCALKRPLNIFNLGLKVYKYPLCVIPL